MFSHILVPLDGSLLAEGAIPHAERFAQVFGGKITLLQVLDSSANQEGPGAIEPLNWQIRKVEAEMYLQRTAGKIQESGIQADFALREGKTAENITDFAHDENVDLVVISTHGISGLSRWNMSSVVAKVLEKIYLPVLLIRAYQEVSDVGEVTSAEGAPVMVEGDRTLQSNDTHQAPFTPVQYRRILLPIDSSRRAECAFPAALAFAKAETGADLILGAVIRTPDLPAPAPYPEEIQQLISRLAQLSHSAVEAYLSELLQRFEIKGEKRVSENANIPAALHQFADEGKADLVILCAHGHTGGNEWPYGSVARNYLEHGTKNVLVIQDVPLSQVQPTMAEQVAARYGRR